MFTKEHAEQMKQLRNFGSRLGGLRPIEGSKRPVERLSSAERRARNAATVARLTAILGPPVPLEKK